MLLLAANVLMGLAVDQESLDSVLFGLADSVAVSIFARLLHLLHVTLA